jgi:hypothetical protein
MVSGRRRYLLVDLRGFWQGVVFPVGEKVILKVEVGTGLLKTLGLSFCKETPCLNCDPEFLSEEGGSCSGVLGLPFDFELDKLPISLSGKDFTNVEETLPLPKVSGTLADFSEILPLEQSINKVVEDSLSTFIQTYKLVLDYFYLFTQISLPKLKVDYSVEGDGVWRKNKEVLEKKEVVFGGLEKEFY